jgi:Family of unknown function (DUF6288)
MSDNKGNSMEGKRQRLYQGWTLTTLVSASLLLTGLPLLAKAPRQAAEPDYTKGEKLLAEHNFVSLGPIGAFGNLWSAGLADPTAKTRMIQIRSVKKGTRAEGVLNVGDVIVGVISPAPAGLTKADTGFDDNARKVLSAAITEAEKKENNGKLVLNVWRVATGKNEPVTIMLPVMDSYSKTSPWACEKTKAIIDASCQTILERGFQRYDEAFETGIPTELDALGLLATGEEKYLPKVQAYVRDLAKRCTSLDIMSDGQGDKGVGTWDGAYRNILLTEYYLATRDEQVIPGIVALSTYLALGQSGVGTWSHGMSDVRQNGLYGPACSYGAMNQCSLTCAISLVLAQKCGINKSEINDAVSRSLNFYRWYVDKGTIPYGDHPPALCHDNNGRNSQAAVMFDLAGDKEAATFFTRMTLASYNIREGGHTGDYFSWLWGALGASRGGPEAAHSFIRNTRWYTELERRPDGGSVYQFALHAQEHGKYTNWSTTGVRLLQHCLPLKTLYITGKGDSFVTPILGDELKATLDAATFDPAQLATTELLAALKSWSMIVRQQAASELGKRSEDVTLELIALLDSPNRYARYGACVGLEHAGRKSERAVDALMKKVENDSDMNLRFFAVNALKLARKNNKENGLREAVKRATPSLLKLAATYEPERDPGRKLQAIIASLMFYGGSVNDYQGFFPGGKGSEKLDRALLIPAIKSFLINPNGAARSEASQIYAYLNDDDLKQLWRDIYFAAKTPAPSGEMFAGGVRINGIKVMAEHQVKEGLEIGTNYVFVVRGWGNGGRKAGGIPALKPYGQGVKDYFPDIEQFLEYVRKDNKNAKTVKAIESALESMKKTPMPELQSIKSYMED